MSKTHPPDAHSGYVGSGCELNGRLHAPGPFHVNGAFRGEILSEDVVSVGKGGSFAGTVFARRVVVEGGGRIAGDIEADEVEVNSGGSIAGATVRSGSLSLAPGGDADGASFQVGRDFRRPRPGADEPEPAQRQPEQGEPPQPDPVSRDSARAEAVSDPPGDPGRN